MSLQINLGIIRENPSTTGGTIRVMEHLQQYVPRENGGKGPFRIVPEHGDGLSVERMIDAKNARAACLTDTERLEGTIPVPQEFHHDGLNCQVNSYIPRYLGQWR